MKLAAWPPLPRWLGPLLARVAALPERERCALLAGGLALLAALEWFAVLPLLQRHDSIVEAARAEAQAATDAHESALQAQQLAADEMAQRTRRVEAELLQLGAGRAGGKGGQRLADLLARTLQAQRVRVVALRELGVDEIEAPSPVAADAAAAPDARQPAAATRVLLYRHRFELSLAGSVPAVLATLANLEQDLRPLRTEQLKLGPDDNGEVLLALVLVGVGTERAWLSL